jgi:hypothetical protein
VRTPRLRRAEPSFDVEHRHVAQQQDRAWWHFAGAEFVVLERRALGPCGGSDRTLTILVRHRRCSATEPLVEADLAEFGLVSRKE